MTRLSIGQLNYGFTDAGPSDMCYAVTSDYADIARNHCAATMLTNIVLLTGSREQLCQDRRLLFRAIHRFVGNGPVLRLQNKANRYFRDANIPLRCQQVNRGLLAFSPERLAAIAAAEARAGRPCALLVAASPLHWHWVTVVGVSEEMSGCSPLIIADGWHARNVYSYVPDRGARLLAVARILPREPN